MGTDEKTLASIIGVLVLLFGAWLAIWPDACPSYYMRDYERGIRAFPKLARFFPVTFQMARLFTRFGGIAILLAFGYALVLTIFS